MICKHCGADLPDNIAFCSACGQPVVPEENAEAPVCEAASTVVEESPAGPAAEFTPPVEGGAPACPQEFVQPVEKPRRNVKRILLAVVAAALALALISGGVAFALHYFSPEESLERAWENTLEDLEKLADHCDTLKKMYEIESELLEDRAFSVMLNMTATDDEPGTISFLYNGKPKDVSIAAELSNDLTTGEDHRSLRIFADKQGLTLGAVFGSAQEQRYYIPMENLSELLPNSALGQQFDMEEAAEVIAQYEQLWKKAFSGGLETDPVEGRYAEEIKAIKESATIEAVEKSIRGAGTLDTVYQFDLDYNTVANLLCKAMRDGNQNNPDEETVQQLIQAITMAGIYLEGMSPEFLFGVRDGRLVAAQVTVEGESVCLLLDLGQTQFVKP